MNNTILAIDIGSTKICAFVAKIENGAPYLLGYGIASSQGIKKGTITNIELASKSIKQAVSEAKRLSGIGLTQATVSISNAYAKSISSTGIVNIANKEIGLKEINRAMQTALYNANIPNEYEVIHVLPYNFKVDEQDFVEDPFGMNAARLEVDVNIIMTQKSNLSNLKKAVRSAGVDIEGLVLNGYASAIAVIDDDEKERGIAVIDMGGQTSNLVVHTGNSIRYNDYLGVGSNHITNDISMALHTPIQTAEEVKRYYGVVAPENPQETIELPLIGDEEQTNEVSVGMIYQVISARVEETLSLLSNSLEKSALSEQLGGGVVLTGGMTKLRGLKLLAQNAFPMHPIRIGKPKKIEGLFDELHAPEFSAIVGLLLYKAGKHTEYEIDFNQQMLHTKVESHTEDLRDLTIHKEHVPQTEESRMPEYERKQQKTRSVESQAEEPSTVSFDEFPTMEEEEHNPVKKLTNWVKQLF